MQFAQSDRSRLARWAPLLLRLVVGYGFAVHGIAKLSRGSSSFASILQSLGVPAPHLMSWVTILSELLGGIAIGTGAFVTIFSVPLAVILLVAIFTVHLPYGFSSIKLIAVTQTGAQFGPPGYECNLLYLAALVALVLGGPGPLAVDALRKGTKRNRPAAATRSISSVRSSGG
jgi:putative oxidoreductase